MAAHTIDGGWTLEIHELRPTGRSQKVGFSLTHDEYRGWHGDVYQGGKIWLPTNSGGELASYTGDPARFIALGKALEGPLGEVVREQANYPPAEWGGTGWAHGSAA